MKNKLFLSLLAAFGLAGAAQAQTTTFVDVATLGEGVSVITSGGTVKVNATVLTKNQRWTRDRVYILANNVIVPNGITLTIEPGTLIRAEQAVVGQGTGAEAALTPSDPGALVVAKGGKLIAAGTADAPIIFTSIDDPNVPGGVATIPPFENVGVIGTVGSTITWTNASGAVTTNRVAAVQRELRSGGTYAGSTTGGQPDYRGQYSYSGGSLTANARNYSTTWVAGSTKQTAFDHDELWGGIVLCGKSTVVKNHPNGENARTTDISEPTINPSTGLEEGSQKGVQRVEGMAGFSAYSWGGGDLDNDDSGILRFVSNRYGGFVIASNAELNSYSFYGVGRNTVLEFLEAYNNADDDFEFWGGDVNLRYAVSAFCGDDGFDTDQGYLGVVQYYVQIANNAIGSDGTSVSARNSANYGDSLTENDGPETHNSAVPYSVYTLANGTLIGRGYALTNHYGSAGPFAGPNFRDNGGARWYNSLVMDNPHGAVLILDGKAPSDTSVSQAGDSSINRYAVERTSGGFDAAGRAADLVTSDIGPANGPDGLFNNVWFFRNGYADSTANGVNGAYTNRADFQSAFTSGLPASTAANRFPASTTSGGRGATANFTNRANISQVQTEITKAANYNVFDQNPGVSVSPYHRLSLDLRISDSSARTLANSALPSYRGLNSDATFVGAVRDNMWMRGWTIGDRLGIYSGSQIVPEVSVAANSSSQPVITFGGETGVKYVVEVSTDNKTYTKVTTVSATAGNNTYIDTARTVGSTPLFYRVIAL